MIFAATMRLVGLLIVASALAACGGDPAPEIEIPPWAKVAPEQIAEAKKHGVPVAFENDLGMRFVLIPAGTFLMGSPEGEEGRLDNETQHEVTISRPFYMQISEVTFRQIRHMEPEHHQGHEILEFTDDGWLRVFRYDRDDYPVVGVAHDRASQWARGVSELDPARTYCLPTESEWEYACRAGTRTTYPWGHDQEEFWHYGNIADVTLEVWAQRYYKLEIPPGVRIHRGPDCCAFVAIVESYKPNAWGLYDMLGNVSEWCSDRYAWDEYAEARCPTVEGLPKPVMSVLRGGSYSDDWTVARPASRQPAPVGVKGRTYGFRLVSPLPESGER